MSIPLRGSWRLLAWVALGLFLHSRGFGIIGTILWVGLGIYLWRKGH